MINEILITADPGEYWLVDGDSTYFIKLYNKGSMHRVIQFSSDLYVVVQKPYQNFMRYSPNLAEFIKILQKPNLRINSINSGNENQKYCMSHLGWTTTKNGLCSGCGSAMLEDEDMT